MPKAQAVKAYNVWVYDGECPKTDLKMGDYQLNTLQKNSVSVPDDWTASMEEI